MLRCIKQDIGRTPASMGGELYASPASSPLLLYLDAVDNML